MHSLTLVTVELPKIKDNYKQDAKIAETLAQLKQKKTEQPDRIFADIYIKRLKHLSTAFARAVDNAISDVMEPYSEEPSNPEYLEFEDHTEGLTDEYNNDSCDCIKLPNGKIVSVESYFAWDRFIIKDGKVYEKYSGPLKHEKRSKRAKKMEALPNYPLKKAYKSLSDYVEQESGVSYNKDYGGYGYLYNPNVFYDWYSIGGRWTELFLVKTSCQEVSLGERSWAETEYYPTPKGYKWVCAARKKDIEWQVMREWKLRRAVKGFYSFKRIFDSDRKSKYIPFKITDDGLFYYGFMYYKKDETLIEYLERHEIMQTYKYPPLFYGYLGDDGYHYKDEMRIDDKNASAEELWDKKMSEYIDSLSDDTVLVGVDCHI